MSNEKEIEWGKGQHLLLSALIIVFSIVMMLAYYDTYTGSRYWEKIGAGFCAERGLNLSSASGNVIRCYWLDEKTGVKEVKEYLVNRDLVMRLWENKTK